MNHTLLATVTLNPIEGTGNFVPSEAGGTGTSCSQIEAIFSTVIGFLTIVAGLAFLIYFVVAALGWITAGGDAKKAENARSNMMNGAIGLIVIVAAYSIVWIVGEILGIPILNPTEAINSLTTGACQ